MTSIRQRVAGVLVLVVLLMAPQVARADGGTVTLDGIDIVAAAHYSCGSDTVEVAPSSITPLDGNWPVWMFGYVYDNASRSWLGSPQWYQVDGITQLSFGVSVPPYAYAWVQYAVYNNGRWDQTGTWVPIENDIDNSPTFCQ